MPVNWSVIICAFNRPEHLRKTLEGLLALDYPKDNYEVVVVDNGPLEETPRVAGSFRNAPVRVSYVKEERPGLSHARNRGIERAKGKYIAFIDDDAVPAPAWLSQLEAGFDRPDIACVGGKVEPVFASGTGWPAWLPDRLKPFYTVVDYGAGGTLRYPDYPAGTNIAFKRSIFDEVGLFRPELGRAGSDLISMDEIDLCVRIEQKGHKILYRPGALVFHRVHEERLSREWMLKRSYGQGVSAARLEKEMLPLSALLLKCLKYALFIPAGGAGRLFFGMLGNMKLAFYCRFQVNLCRAYLKMIMHVSG